MAATDVGAWDKFKSMVGGTVIAVVAEMHSLLPDSILFGSILLYFLTQHSAYGVFSVFLMESMLLHHIVSWISKGSVGPSRPKDDLMQEVKCRAGYKTAQYTPKRIFQYDPYPSYGIYSLTAIIGYTGSAMYQYAPTLNEMKDSWTSRPFFAFLCMGLLLLAFILVRLYYCDAMGEVIVATLLGAAAGTVLYQLNKLVFGVESMNFLGLPYMASKDAAGKTIYACQRVTP
jgi:hypothetical protein